MTGLAATIPMIALALKAFFHGIVEGITEFLPVSSTGHLILLNEIEALRLPDPFADSFAIVVQFGAIVATILYFWHDLWPWSPRKSAVERRATWTLWGLIAIATLPALAIGAVLKDAIKEHLFTTPVVCAMLLVGGIALLLLERRCGGASSASIDAESKLTWKDALLVGCFQCLALIPGTSRSAATIIGALAIGFSRPLAARFSFFLAIPTLTAAAAYETLTGGLGGTDPACLVALAVGMAAAFAVSWLVIAGLMRFIQRHDFRVFGWYRVALAILVFGLLAAGAVARTPRPENADASPSPGLSR